MDCCYFHFFQYCKSLLSFYPKRTRDVPYKKLHITTQGIISLLIPPFMSQPLIFFSSQSRLWHFILEEILCILSDLRANRCSRLLIPDISFMSDATSCPCRMWVHCNSCSIRSRCTKIVVNAICVLEYSELTLDRINIWIVEELAWVNSSAVKDILMR